MTESEHRKWEIIIQAVAPILTIAGILVGIWQFSRQQNETLAREYAMVAKNDSLEFKRKFWEKLLNVYSNLCVSAGDVARSVETPRLFKAEADSFYSVYWGNMIFIQDDSVEITLKAFYLTVQDYPGTADSSLLSDYDLLIKQRLFGLADACSYSLNAIWFSNR